MNDELEIAMAHHRAGRLAEAERGYRAILARNDRHAEALQLLGVIAHQRGAHAVANELIERAIALQPDHPEFHFNRAMALHKLGRSAEAATCLQEAVRLAPHYTMAHYQLGLILGDLARHGGAIAALERTLQLDPSHVGAYCRLAATLREMKRFTEAEALFRTALSLAPRDPVVHYHFGGLCREQGKLAEALSSFRTAVQLKPDFVAAHSALVFALWYEPRATPAEILAAHREWDRAHAAPLRGRQPTHPRATDATRRLRIGYMSGDFRDHAVGRNVYPLLQHHDRAQFEVIAYSNSRQVDDITRRLRAETDHWREIAGIDDDRVAAMVQSDQIDILVDLNLHTVGNRLLVFARKPAPIQVTFAGYPGTTGLSAIDYRLTDPQLDPPGFYDEHYSERSRRLPHSFWCFDPIDDRPPLRARASDAANPIAWGCLNNPNKINAETLALWAEVLRATPHSRLHVLVANDSDQARVVGALTRSGIADTRIELLPIQRRYAYLEYYNRCDVILDTFPYNGHSTACDALWMGVPIVTLSGATVVSRAGASILANVGLSELVAQNATDFVRIAVALAADRGRLHGLHTSLRSRMEASPLMDGKQFARGIEAQYRRMWQDWCAS